MTHYDVPPYHYVCGNCGEKQYYPWSVTENGVDFCSYYCADQYADSDVPDLHEITDKREFITHVMFYGFDKDELDKLNGHQLAWLKLHC